MQYFNSDLNLFYGMPIVKIEKMYYFIALLTTELVAITHHFNMFFYSW